MPDDFQDKDFPAEQKVLLGNARQEYNGAADRRMEQYKFKRISDIIDNLKIITPDLSCQDIRQGALGNCYFMSAISAVAEVPDRIKRNFLQKDPSEKGAYCIALNILGSWTPVIIDDIFAVDEYNRLSFSKAKDDRIWPILLEKAYAKAYGAYSHIGAGGSSLNALKDLTSAPCIHLSIDNPEEECKVELQIKEASKAGFIMTCSSRGGGESKTAQGIIRGHAYTLSGMYRLSNKKELLKLRNPWGEGEWSGNWGRNSRLWTEDLKREVNLTNIEDGSFFIDYADFK